MKIFNVTKNKLIASNAKEPSSPLSEAIGLIGARKASAFILKTRFGIHTFGLLFSIDVLILDKEKKVAVLKENLKPFRFFLWKPHYNTVLELPQGTIQKSNTEIGDKLSLKN